MAQTKSARKHIRQDLKRRSRNRRRKSVVKQTVRAFNEAVSGGQADQAAETLKKVYSELDAAAAKGTIHKNAAARRKSRLARRLRKVASG